MPVARWRTVQDLRPHLDPIVAELGRMPGHADLKVRGRSDLINAVRKFGGHAQVAAALGYQYEGRTAWSSVEDLRPHLAPIVAELGYMPRPRDLVAEGRHDLANAIQKFGGFPKVAAALGYPYGGYQSWKSLEDLRPHLDPIVAELGRMPGQRELKALERLDLVGAVNKFGGHGKVAAALGYPYEGPRYWPSVEDFRPHLDPIVAELGRMPRQVELLARNRADLVSAMHKFGGVRKVAAALGHPYEGRVSWSSVEDLRQHLDPLVANLGRMPPTNELRALGRDYLVGAVLKFGGFPKVAAALGYPYEGRNAWSSVQDLRLHLDPIVAQLGRMPTRNELTAKGRGDLSGPIRKFGGNTEVAAALGYPYEGYQSWTTVEDLRPHLDPMVAELGRMPGQVELKARGRGDLPGAVHKFGGIRTVAAALGYRYEGLNSWSSVEDLRLHLDPIVAELGRFPGRRELVARGRTELIDAISKFGGVRSVAAALGYLYEGYQYWSSVEDLRLHLDPIVTELGRMPSQVELKERRRGDLSGAIHKFGGFPTVAAALGYPHDGRSAWSSVEALRPHLDPIVAELGRMPYQLELRERGRGDVVGAINKFGGFPKIAEALGYPYGVERVLERRDRYKRLEAAILELHRAQQLSPGDILILLRHAGLLSRRDFAEVADKLQAATVLPGTDLQSALDELGDVLMRPDDARAAPTDGPAGTDGVPCVGTEEPAWPIVPNPVDADIAGPNSLGADDLIQASSAADGLSVLANAVRDAELEVKELRGWSAVGNLLDPSPALVRLGVTRLKNAFYGFAADKYRTLEAPIGTPTDEEISRLSADLQQAAFGAYGAYLTNDLVREAADAYISDLSRSLLLPRATDSHFTPRLYQLDGARFLAERAASADQPFGLLLDQPGMGKSLTTLWGLAAAGSKRFIIVSPLTVKNEVWTLATIRVAFPSLPEERVARSLDAALAMSFDGPSVVLLHYQELHRHEQIRALSTSRIEGSCPFDALIFDEAHEVKERLSGTKERGPLKQGAWLLRRAAHACFGITATPLINELYEPVSLLQLAKGNDDPELGRRLRTARLRDRVDVMEFLLADSLRRTKVDVLREIPSRPIHTHDVVPTSDQLTGIQAFLARSRRAVARDLPSYRRLMLDAKLDWLAREADQHRLAISDDGLPDPKVLVLCYNVDAVSERVYQRLVDTFGAARIRHINGATPLPERAEALDAFRAPADSQSGVFALVGTVGTVGVGLTLFDANEPVTPHRVIFADLPYTWAEFEQGVDRLHRVGQKYPVTVDVPIVSFAGVLTSADGEPLKSFDGWVWDLIASKQRLADQVLDAAFDVSSYAPGQVQRAIRNMLRALEEAGGAIVAPPPPDDSPQAEHRRRLGRYRGLPRERISEMFRLDPTASQQFLQENDASRASKVAQELVRDRVGRWLDARSTVVDLGCGSNPLRDLPCHVIGIDRHGVNGGRIGDMATSGLPDASADLAVMSLSMWGTPADRLAYLREAKRILRPLGKLIIIEPSGPFGGVGSLAASRHKLGQVAGLLGMHLAEASEHTLDASASLVSFVIDNSTAPARNEIDPESCRWVDYR